MPCVQRKDDAGYLWVVNEERTFPKVECWWQRSEHKWDGKSPAENIVLRQENGGDNGVDVILLTFGQVYDLIDALNRAVMEP